MRKQKKKRPAIMFYHGDWLKEPSLRKSSLAARGAWADLLMLMAADDADRITATMLQFSRAIGCTYGDAEQAIHELIDNGVCDVEGRAPAPPDSVTKNGHVTICHSAITLVCRRYAKEHKARAGNAERQRRHRKKS